MFILINKDDFYGYEIVLNCFGKSKIFRSVEEINEYVNEMELHTYQVVEVTI